MPTLAQVRTKVDDWLALRYPTIVSRQDTYFLANGRYWQGLRTHVGHIDYDENTDAESLGDNMETSPTDQAESWSDAFPTLSGIALPAVFIMDVYQNADGWGWVVTVYVRFNGTIYTRSRNGAGTETNRTQGWRVYTPSDI